jgi:hypothetical protein
VIVAWVLIGALYLIWRESVQKVKIDLDYAFREVGGDAPILETEPLEEIAV